MKKFAYFLMVIIVLTSCAQVNATEKTENKKVKKQPEQTLVKRENVYVPSPQVTDDRNLVEVGKTISDDKGALTLKSYKAVNKTVKIGPVEMLIKDVKVFRFVPDYSMIDFFHAYTHDEEFDFVKVAVEVKNKSNKPVKFTPIASLNMSTQQPKTWEDDIYLEELGGKIEGKETRQGNLGYIIEDKGNNQWVELLTSDAIDMNHKIIEQGKKMKVEF